MLAYVDIPVLQKELDTFRIYVWNNHRVHKQKGKQLPSGVPEHIYHCPEQYGGEKCGLPIAEEQLMEVANLSNVLEGTDDCLGPNFRKECERHIPNTAFFLIFFLIIFICVAIQQSTTTQRK